MMTKALRVLHIDAGNLFGGVEKMLSIIAGQSDWDLRLERHFAVCFPGSLSEALLAAGVPVYFLTSVRVRYPWQVWRARRRLAALLAEKRFDAVICHMPWSYAIFASVVRRAGIPVVFWMHDVGRGKHWSERWAKLTPPDLAIINSRFTSGSLARIFPHPPPYVIIHGPAVPSACIAEQVTDRATTRLLYDTPVDITVILQLGRFEPYKGHILHLEALAQLKDLPDWVCWIAGGAQRPEEERYLTKMKALVLEYGLAGRIRFTGHLRDVQPVLAAADIFCQPNIAPEPFGRVFIEALYNEIPAVTTNMGGAVEIVDETCGFVVPPADPKTLAGALRRLIVDPDLRIRLGRNGPARAGALSDPHIVLDQLERALKEMIACHRNPPAAGHNPFA